MMGHRLPFGPLAQQVSPVDRGRPRQDKFALSGNAIPGDFVPISNDDALALLRPAAGRVLRALWALQPIQRAGLLDAEALIRPRYSRSKKPRARRGAFASCEAVGLVAVIIPMTPRPLVAAAVIAVIPAPVVAPAVRHATPPMIGMKAAPATEGGFNDVRRSRRDAEIRNRGSRVGGHRRDAQSQSAGDKKS